MDWNGKPYHSLDYEMKTRFGTKVYKISLDGGMTCPNRDGTLGTRGCIFCSEGGSGDFAAQMQVTESNSAFSGRCSTVRYSDWHSGTATVSSSDWRSDAATVSSSDWRSDSAAVSNSDWRSGAATVSSSDWRFDAATIQRSISAQIEEAAGRISRKLGNSPHAYIAYFQSYTNTYAPVSYLRELFTAAIRHPDVKVLSIATRPDCLPDEVLELCAELNRIKPVWLELGLQTIHSETAQFIRRGYDLDCFEDALKRLRSRGLEAIVHVILGLPGEDRDQMLETVSYLAHADIQGIKLQLLHVLEGTDLAEMYRSHPFPVLELDEYLDLVLDCVALLPPEMVIHRITGDGPKKLLIAPLWSANKRLVLNSLSRRFRERGVVQGDARK